MMLAMELAVAKCHALNGSFGIPPKIGMAGENSSIVWEGIK
jgi:hypothetical protein